MYVCFYCIWSTNFYIPTKFGFFNYNLWFLSTFEGHSVFRSDNLMCTIYVHLHTRTENNREKLNEHLVFNMYEIFSRTKPTQNFFINECVQLPSYQSLMKKKICMPRPTNSIVLLHYYTQAFRRDYHFEHWYLVRSIYLLILLTFN